MNETAIEILVRARDEATATLNGVVDQLKTMGVATGQQTDSTAKQTAYNRQAVLGFRQVGSVLRETSMLMMAGSMILGYNTTGWQRQVSAVLRFATAASIMISVLIRLNATLKIVQATQALSVLGPYALPVAAAAAVGGVGYLLGKKLFGYAQGGDVPGPVGVPSLAVVHGGERILRPGNGGNGGVQIHIHTLAADESTLRKAAALFQRYQRENARLSEG